MREYCGDFGVEKIGIKEKAWLGSECSYQRR